tara:strand:+ start:388772 stop:389041 length:270 start_codon:yes stop_codon:yes gene_type:complete
VSREKEKSSLLLSVAESESDFLEVEKKTLSIRLTTTSVEKISKRVEKLKGEKMMPAKYTASGYLSKIIEDFVDSSIDLDGNLNEKSNGQ